MEVGMAWWHGMVARGATGGLDSGHVRAYAHGMSGANAPFEPACQVTQVASVPFAG